MNLSEILRGLKKEIEERKLFLEHHQIVDHPLWEAIISGPGIICGPLWGSFAVLGSMICWPVQLPCLAK